MVEMMSGISFKIIRGGRISGDVDETRLVMSWSLLKPDIGYMGLILISLLLYMFEIFNNKRKSLSLQTLVYN